MSTGKIGTCHERELCSDKGSSEGQGWKRCSDQEHIQYARLTPSGLAQAECRLCELTGEIKDTDSQIQYLLFGIESAPTTTGAPAKELNWYIEKEVESRTHNAVITAFSKLHWGRENIKLNIENRNLYEENKLLRARLQQTQESLAKARQGILRKVKSKKSLTIKKQHDEKTV